MRADTDQIHDLGRGTSHSLLNSLVLGNFGSFLFFFLLLLCLLPLLDESNKGGGQCVFVVSVDVGGGTGHGGGRRFSMGPNLNGFISNIRGFMSISDGPGLSIANG